MREEGRENNLISGFSYPMVEDRLRAVQCKSEKKWTQITARHKNFFTLGAVKLEGRLQRELWNLHFYRCSEHDWMWP